jgi:hypothetical protein
MKFYIVALFLTILINGIYPLWATYYVCNNYTVLKQDSCLTVGVEYYIDFNILIQILVDNAEYDIANVISD